MNQIALVKLQMSVDEMALNDMINEAQSRGIKVSQEMSEQFLHSQNDELRLEYLQRSGRMEEYSALLKARTILKFARHDPAGAYMFYDSQSYAPAEEDCRREYATKARVCVEVSRAGIDCDKGYSGRFYDSCDVAVTYNLRTEYTGESNLNVQVECGIQIGYKGPSDDSWRSDGTSKNTSHSLRARRSASDSFSVTIPFAASYEVRQSKIRSVTCSIEGITLQ